MNQGGFSTVLRTDLLRFNGGLFADANVIPLNREQNTPRSYVDRLVMPTVIEPLREEW